MHGTTSSVPEPVAAGVTTGWAFTGNIGQGGLGMKLIPTTAAGPEKIA